MIKAEDLKKIEVECDYCHRFNHIYYIGEEELKKGRIQCCWCSEYIRYEKEGLEKLRLY